MVERHAVSVERNAISWFEIPVHDMARAKAFYEKVMQVSMDEDTSGANRMAFFPMTDDGYGAPGALAAGPEYKPAGEGITIYFNAGDIEGTLGRVEQAGGKVLQNKSSIGKWGYIAYFKDTEGNRIGLHSVS